MVLGIAWGAHTSSSTTPPSSIIKSIQNFSITLGSTVASNTATISSVTTANAYVVLSGENSSDAIGVAASSDFGYLDLTNATTVTATRSVATVGNVLTIVGTVIELTSAAVVSIQKGTISIGNGATSNTATISSVTTANAFPVLSGIGTTIASASINANGIFSAIDLTNATTVTAVRNTAGTANTISYTIVELASGILVSNQKISATFTSSSTTDDVTISAVTMANTLVLNNGMTTNITSMSNSSLFINYLTSTTNLRFERYGTSTTTRTMKATVLEFSGTYIASKSAAQVTIANTGTVQDTTVTSFTSNKGWLNACGMAYNAAGATTNSFLTNCTSTSSTNVRCARVGSSQAQKTAFELLEFV